MTSPPEVVLVVGAGMAGLTAATELARHGRATIVVDKSRAPGGRMASRTIGPARFDQGAQRFEARVPAFMARVEDWRAQGLVRSWPHGADGAVVGVGGMRRVPEHLAADLDVRTATTVRRVAGDRTGVTATLADGSVIEAAAAILTPPLPQLLALVDGTALDLPDGTRSALAAVTYEPCLAVMAHLDGPSGLPDGHLTPDDGDLAWMADNQDKGVSAVPSLTIHSTGSFAAAHLEDDPEGWVAHLVDEARPHLAAGVVAATGHRWRFSQPSRSLDVGAVAAGGAPIVLAGDAFAQGDVEGAFLSGVAAAEEVLGRG